MSVRTFKTTGNDNYFDMDEEWQRDCYEWMRSQSQECSHADCFCAYCHIGWCNKCGHYRPQLMLNAAPTSVTSPEGVR